MEVGSVESDMVLPYVATKALKSRTGSKLRVVLGEEEGDGDLVARGHSETVEGKDRLLGHHAHLVAGHHRGGGDGHKVLYIASKFKMTEQLSTVSHMRGKIVDLHVI